MRHPGLASTRLRSGLALVIVMNMGLAAVVLGAASHSRSPEVALPLAGQVEIPVAAPRETPVAPGQSVGTAVARTPGSIPRKTQSAAKAGAHTAVTSASTPSRSNAAALQQWRSALADRNNHPADVVVVGDSITEGYFVTDADRWITTLRDDLRADNPAGVAGGEGFIPAWHLGRKLDQSSPSWSQRWTLNGFTDDWVDSGYGLGRRSLVFTDVRQTASITVAADRLWVAYTEGPDEGFVRITVDNQLPTLVNTRADVTRSGRVWDSGALAAGAHTVTVAAVAGNKAVLDGLMPFRGDGGTGANVGRGARVWDGGHGTYTSGDFAAGPPYWSQGFDIISPDLVIIELGSNDQYFNQGPEVLRANLTTIVDGVRARATAAGMRAPSIALMPVWAANDKSASDWGRYRAAMLAVADHRGCAVLDVWNEVHQAPATPGGLFFDRVHPSPAGHRWLGDTVNRLLAA